MDAGSEVSSWFFEKYFVDFIEIGAGRLDPEKILAYWGVPLHMSGPAQARWLTSSEDVIRSLIDMQGLLRRSGYTHTEALDRKVVIYNENAGRVETIMSRRREDGSEIDRAAISFEVRRAANDWVIISTSAQTTQFSKLSEVW